MIEFAQHLVQQPSLSGEEAALAGNLPTMAQLRGKFMFILFVRSNKRLP